MVAYSTSSGGVMFVPDDQMQKKDGTLSYSEFLEQQSVVARTRIFGKKKVYSDKDLSSDDMAHA